MDDPEDAKARRGKPAARVAGRLVAVVTGVALACFLAAPDGTAPAAPGAAADDGARYDGFVKRFRRGQELFGSGTDAEAEKIFRALLVEEPDAAAVHHALAFVMWFRGRPADAIEGFQKAAELAPDDGAIRRDCGLRLMDVGRVKDALPHLEAAKARLDSDVETLCALGRCYATLGRQADALRVLRSAHALEPDSVDARALLARQLLQQQPAEALKLVEPVPPNWPDVVQVRALALEALARWSDAAGFHARAAELTPPGEAGLPILRDAAEGLVRCGDASRGAAVAASWVARDREGGHPSLRSAVCLAVARCGAADFDGARAALDDAPSDDKLAPQPRATIALVRVHLLAEAGRADDARKVLEKVAAIDAPFEAALARFVLGTGPREPLDAAAKTEPSRANDVAWAVGVRARLAGEAAAATDAYRRAAELSKPPGEHPGGLLRRAPATDAPR